MTSPRTILVLALGISTLCVAPTTPAAAQSASRRPDADTITVRAAVRRALQENPSIQAVRQQRNAAATSIREVRAGWFPAVQGVAQYRRLSDNVDYTVDLPSIPGTGTQPVTFAPAILNRYSARATVEQPVFTGFRLPNQLDAAQSETKAARAQVSATEQDIAFRTRVAYWTLYRAQVRQEAAENGLRRLERQLTDARNRRDAGMATEADVLQVRARRDEVRVEVIQARNEVQSARRTLNDQMGRALDTPIVLKDTVTVDTMRSPGVDLVEKAREQRPDLRALRHRVNARKAEVDVAQSDWFPQVSLTGSYLYAQPNEQLFPPEDRFQGTWEAGVRLSWQLSVGGATDAATDRAQARHLQAQYEFRDRRRSVAVEVRQQAERVTQAREAVRAANTSLRSAREAYRAVRSRSEEGMAVMSDLLDAEERFRTARARLAGAEAEYARARASLTRALGRLKIDNGQ